jgi:hypothetical protein
MKLLVTLTIPRKCLAITTNADFMFTCKNIIQRTTHSEGSYTLNFCMGVSATIHKNGMNHFSSVDMDLVRVLTPYLSVSRHGMRLLIVSFTPNACYNLT